nr:outer membrane beta-barrel protein [uncultured Flavobacterium sp.]
MIIGHKMNDKKNIDRLFQEQLKDFEVNPPEFVWENIREKLEEKKKRRAVPIWFRYSGVAAGLVAGAFFGWQYLNGDDAAQKQKTNDGVVLQQVGDEPGKPVNPEKVLNPDGSATTTAGRKNTLSNNRSTLVSNDADSDTDKGNTISAKASKKPATGTATGVLPATQSARGLVQGENSDKQDKKSKRNNAKALPDTDAQIAYENKGKASSGSGNGMKNRGEHNASDKINTTPGSFTNGSEAVAGNNKAATTKPTGVVPQTTTSNAVLDSGEVVASAQNNNATNKTSGINSASSAKGQKYDDGNKRSENATSGIAANDKNANGSAFQNSVAGINDQDDTRVNGTLPVIDKDIVPGNLLPGEQKLLAQVTDTVKPVTENELEKMLREKESGKKDEQMAETMGPRWNVKPQVAPLFYNSFSSGSPIDQQFASNSKNYDKDLSVGLGLNYAINDRLSIRSGVNTVNLNYATQDIQFHASLESSTSNITAKVSSARNANIVVTTRDEGFISNGTTDSYNGSMVQTTGYIEVPLEMSYALLKKKFGIEVIGGVSTLFLNENKVSVVSNQGLATTVGEAENLNDVHFSTNIGIGFKYRIFKALEASFEPTLKYQVNTYSRDAGNFKPYFIGLYSGVSFSF